MEDGWQEFLAIMARLGQPAGDMQLPTRPAGAPAGTVPISFCERRGYQIAPRAGHQPRAGRAAGRAT